MESLSNDEFLYKTQFHETMKLYESKEYDIQELYQRKEVSFSNNIEIF